MCSSIFISAHKSIFGKNIKRNGKMMKKEKMANNFFNKNCKEKLLILFFIKNL